MAFKHQHISHPLPASPLLLITFPSKRWKRCDIAAVNGSLNDAAEPGLIFLGAAQSRGCDGVHVSLVLHVKLDHILPLLIRALIFLLKIKDILHGNLGDGWRDRAGCQDKRNV